VVEQPVISQTGLSRFIMWEKLLLMVYDIASRLSFR
jgi:hypothetical protein